MHLYTTNSLRLDAAIRQLNVIMVLLTKPGGVHYTALEPVYGRNKLGKPSRMFERDKHAIRSLGVDMVYSEADDVYSVERITTPTYIYYGRLQRMWAAVLAAANRCTLQFIEVYNSIYSSGKDVVHKELEALNFVAYPPYTPETFITMEMNITFLTDDNFTLTLPPVVEQRIKQCQARGRREG